MICSRVCGWFDEGDYGAFIFSHDDVGSSLWVMINKDVAYIHYFPDNTGKHPGFQATGMTPAGCVEDVYFIQPDGGAAGWVHYATGDAFVRRGCNPSDRLSSCIILLPRRASDGVNYSNGNLPNRTVCASG